MTPRDAAPRQPALEGLRPALSLATILAEADRGMVILRDDGPACHVVLHDGPPDDDAPDADALRDDVGLLGTALRERRTVTIPDLRRSTDPAAALTRAAGCRALTLVPLLDGADAVGALALMRHAPGAPPPAALPLLERCAEGAAALVACDRDRRHAEMECAEALAQGQARVQLLARMTHELRTPLQSIAGYADLLSLGLPSPPTAQQGEILERLRRSERMLSGVIDELITFARLEAGRIEYHLCGVVAGDALTATADIVAPLAAERGISVVVERGPDDVAVLADPDKLLQVLINLATNALKFTPRGGTVRLAWNPASDTEATFVVADDGRGIPADKLDAIFSPYVQLGVPTARGAGGSGLGLAISREFALGMRGALTAESGPGPGSTFRLRLPRYGAAGGDASAPLVGAGAAADDAAVVRAARESFGP